MGDLYCISYYVELYFSHCILLQMHRVMKNGFSLDVLERTLPYEPAVKIFSPCQENLNPKPCPKP